VSDDAPVTSDEVVTELVRGLARRASFWRRSHDRAMSDRDRIRREAGLTLRAVASALGAARPHTLTDLSALRAMALKLRSDNVELSDALRLCRDTLATVLERRGDAHHPAYGWMAGPLDEANLDAAELAAEVTDLRGRLEQLRELNQGWARYGERVKERRRNGCPRCGRGREDEVDRAVDRLEDGE